MLVTAAALLLTISLVSQLPAGVTYSHYADVVRDRMGRSVSGASVYVYTAGTQTVVPIYQNATGTTVSTNPLSTDPFGRFDFYVAPGVYDIFVSRQGIDDWTQEDVPIGTHAADKAAFYGIIGDGATDDTDAMQLYIDAVAAGTEDVVTLPTGTFVVTNLTITSPNVRILGSGRDRTIIKQDDSAADAVIDIYANNYGELRDLKVQAKQDAEFGVVVSNSQWFLMENVNIQLPGNANRALDIQNSNHIDIKNSRIYNIPGDPTGAIATGIWLQNNSYVDISGVDIGGVSNAVTMWDVDAAIIHDCAMAASPAGYALGILCNNTSSRANIISNVFTDFTDGISVISGTTGPFLAGNVFEDVTSAQQIIAPGNTDTRRAYYINSEGQVFGDVLKWDGSAWVPVAPDDDPDTTIVVQPPGLVSSSLSGYCNVTWQLDAQATGDQETYYFIQFQLTEEDGTYHAPSPTYGGAGDAGWSSSLSFSHMMNILTGQACVDGDAYTVDLRLKNSDDLVGGPFNLGTITVTGQEPPPQVIGFDGHPTASLDWSNPFGGSAWDQATIDTWGQHDILHLRTWYLHDPNDTYNWAGINEALQLVNPDIILMNYIAVMWAYPFQAPYPFWHPVNGGYVGYARDAVTAVDHEWHTEWWDSLLGVDGETADRFALTTADDSLITTKGLCFTNIGNDTVQNFMARQMADFIDRSYNTGANLCVAIDYFQVPWGVFMWADGADTMDLLDNGTGHQADTAEQESLTVWFHDLLTKYRQELPSNVRIISNQPGALIDTVLGYRTCGVWIEDFPCYYADGDDSTNYYSRALDFVATGTKAGLPEIHHAYFDSTRGSPIIMLENRHRNQEHLDAVALLFDNCFGTWQVQGERRFALPAADFDIGFPEAYAVTTDDTMTRAYTKGSVRVVLNTIGTDGAGAGIYTRAQFRDAVSEPTPLQWPIWYEVIVEGTTIYSNFPVASPDITTIAPVPLQSGLAFTITGNDFGSVEGTVELSGTGHTTVTQQVLSWANGAIFCIADIGDFADDEYGFIQVLRDDGIGSNKYQAQIFIVELTPTIGTTAGDTTLAIDCNSYNHPVDGPGDYTQITASCNIGNSIPAQMLLVYKIAYDDTWIPAVMVEVPPQFVWSSTFTTSPTATAFIDSACSDVDSLHIGFYLRNEDYRTGQGYSPRQYGGTIAFPVTADTDAPGWDNANAQIQHNCIPVIGDLQAIVGLTSPTEDCRVLLQYKRTGAGAKVPADTAAAAGANWTTFITAADYLFPNYYDLVVATGDACAEDESLYVRFFMTDAAGNDTVSSAVEGTASADSWWDGIELIWTDPDITAPVISTTAQCFLDDEQETIVTSDELAYYRVRNRVNGGTWSSYTGWTSARELSFCWHTTQTLSSGDLFESEVEARDEALNTSSDGGGFTAGSPTDCD